MRWEDERYVRVYTRDTTDWLAFSFEAQALLLMLLRKVDRAGILPLGKHGKRGVAIAVGHPRDWDRLEPALEELLADGCVRMGSDGASIVVPNFIFAQEARASDKARQQKARELARDLAAAESVTHGDVSSQIVTTSHAVSHAVTPCHTPSPLAVLSRAVPSRETTVSPAVAVAAPEVDERQQVMPGFDPPAAPPEVPKPPRKPSPGEELYAKIQRVRRTLCDEAGESYVDDRWTSARQNKFLGPIAKGSEQDKAVFETAFGEFMADEAHKAKGWPLSLFMHGATRARYEKRALDALKAAS